MYDSYSKSNGNYLLLQNIENAIQSTGISLPLIEYIFEFCMARKKMWPYMTALYTKPGKILFRFHFSYGDHTNIAQRIYHGPE